MARRGAGKGSDGAQRTPSRRVSLEERFQALDADDRERLVGHLKTLRMESLGQYGEWCEVHGFPVGLRKTPSQRARERKTWEEEIAEAALKRSRRARRRPEALIDEITAPGYDPGHLDPALRRVHEAAGTVGRRAGNREAFRRLLRHVVTCSDLIRADHPVAEYPRDVHNSYPGALASLATCHRSWLQPPEDWRPRSHNARRQFASLARHLLARHEVPAFMDTCWFRRSRTQTWFVHVGMGHNIRTAERIPIDMTRRMAHEMMSAPSHYTVEHALRWGQIHGLGGNPRVADGIRRTRLGESFAHDGFWSTVLRFFIANPLLDVAQYGPIVDYIQNQRFEETEVFVPPGRVQRQPPPHPGFSMRRRNPETLLRQVEDWHRRLGRIREGRSDLAWQPSGIEPFELVTGQKSEKKVQRWTIRELVSSEALIQEGRQMRHCVGSYVPSCASGRTSIWSMECADYQGRDKVLTIEVRTATKLVVEARGRFNAFPTPQAMEVLRLWATRAGLQVPNYIAPA